ncbi:YciI family protein [Asticcacaulis taihuensis]|uniref:YCII-related domain-containing protein n=1 Tax=Asticcacaulis taihuensis TaxID=260084 RepID=A0A1G4QRZ4_9CAUL|nr:YciI family protein [Asticcacaulis taihuensis]SCW47414.1 YCII-related domain-containing protein [Asticcacaulis taihuensis]
MADFIFLMHDTPNETPNQTSGWPAYLDGLARGGHLRGGSAIGSGAAFRKNGAASSITAHLTGFIRIEADSLAAAQTLLAGNPVYEAGGIVEIRELPETD